MIKVSLTMLVFLYLLGLGGTILIFWYLLERYMSRPVPVPKIGKMLIRCDICHFDFVDSSSDRYIKCPNCNTLLDRDKIVVSGFTSEGS